MGLFDRLFGRNKQNQLPEGQGDYRTEEEKYRKIQERINSEGNSIEIYFNPAEWKKMSDEEKSESIVGYSLEEEELNGEKSSIVLVDLLTKNQEGKNIEINLLRYTKSDNIQHNLKNVTELIKKLLDSQNNENVSKMDKIKYISKLQNLIHVNKGDFSKEGKAILQNENANEISMDRTVFIERDEEGYIYSYQEKNDINLINNLIDTINDKNKLVKRKETIDIETDVIDEKVYESLDEKRDLLMGVISLCRLANNLNIGVPVDTIGKEDASTTYNKLRNTPIGFGLSEQTEIRSRLEKHTIDVCIKLESLIEKFNYDKDFIVFSEDDDEKVRKLLDSVLRFSKKEFKKQVEYEHEEHEKEHVSYYRQMVDRLNNTINELKGINTALKDENAKLTQQNESLLEEIQQLKDERSNVIDFIKENLASSTNEEMVKLITQFDKYAYDKNVIGAIKLLKEKSKEENKENEIEKESQSREDI